MWRIHTGDKHAGKANESLLLEQDSPKCPEVSATTLNSTDIELTKELAGKVTLLCVGCRDFAMVRNLLHAS
jgi:hypothetical protein